MHMYVCAYVFVCVCVYVCVCVCTYAFVCVCTCTFVWDAFSRTSIYAGEIS